MITKLIKRKTCFCGCKKFVTRSNQKFIHTHNSKIIPKEGWNYKCDCGCGETTGEGNRFVNHHNSKHMSPETKNKIKVKVTGKRYIGRKVSKQGLISMSKAQKGRRHSLENTLKRSASMIRRKQTEAHVRKRVGSRIANDNYKTSEATIELMVQSRKGYVWSKETRIKMEPKIKRGADSNFWMGGISSSEYGPEFTKELRNKIRERDNHTCQICQTKHMAGKKFPVHHIDYNKKNNDPDNLIALCNECHLITNGNRNIWTKFIQFILPSLNKYGVWKSDPLIMM